MRKVFTKAEALRERSTFNLNTTGTGTPTIRIEKLPTSLLSTSFVLFCDIEYLKRKIDTKLQKNPTKTI